MRISWLCALVVVAVGCGSVSGKDTDGGTGDGAPAGDFTLSLTAPAALIAIGGTATFPVFVQRGAGVAGDITLTAENLPAHITLAFATNPVPAGTEFSDMTINIAGGAPVATSAVTLTGTDGTHTHSVTLTITTRTITVDGMVAGGMAGVTVGLVGKSSVVSDGAGRFTFTDVTPPYDLYTYRVATFSNIGGGSIMTPSIIFYDNLTRPDPIIRVAPDTGGFQIFFAIASEKVTGMRLGTGNNTSASAIAWSVDNANPIGAINSTGAFEVNAQWFGTAGSQKTGTLFGLQWTAKASGAPDQYIGFGSQAMTLTSGTPDTTQNLTFVNPTEAGLVGTITPPSGYNPAELQLNQQFGDTTVKLWSTTTTTNAASSIVTGTTLGKAAIYAKAASPAAETSEYVYPALTAATDVGFAMPAAAVLNTPTTGAANIDTASDFTITAAPGALFVYTIATGGTQRASYTIYSEATTVRIPNVAERTLPPNQSFSWSVTAYGPFTVNDSATTSDVPTIATPADYTGTKRFQTRSVTKTFTSKP